MVSNVRADLRAGKICTAALDCANARNRLVSHRTQVVLAQFGRTSPSRSERVVLLCKARRLSLTFLGRFNVTHLEIQCKLVECTIIMLRTFAFYTNWLQKYNMNISAASRTHCLF